MDRQDPDQRHRLVPEEDDGRRPSGSPSTPSTSRSPRPTAPTTSRPDPELAKGWVERTPKRLHDEREGVQPLHRPSDAARLAVARHPRRPPGGGRGEAQRLRAPPRRHRDGRGVEAVPARAATAGLRRQARRGAHAVSEVVHPEAREPRGARRDAGADGGSPRLRRVPGARAGWPRTTRSGRWRSSATSASRWSCSTRRASRSCGPCSRRRPTPSAVVRFHGRADDRWDDRSASAAERFRYLYDRRQLGPGCPASTSSRRRCRRSTS